MINLFEPSMSLVLIAITGSMALLVMSFLESVPGRTARTVAMAIVAAVLLQATPGFAQNDDEQNPDRVSITNVASSVNTPEAEVISVQTVRVGSGRDRDDRDRTVHFATSSGLHFYAGGEVDVTSSADELFVAGGEVKIDSSRSAAMTVGGRRCFGARRCHRSRYHFRRYC